MTLGQFTGRDALSQATGPATTQAGWRWCSKCQGMHYARATANTFGVCPAGGAHIQAGSGQYIAMIGQDVANVQQGGWRWCSRCQGMFYSRTANSMGVCPAGGPHIMAASGQYALIIGEDAPRPRQQGGWRWCHKCQGSFYARASAGMGRCQAGAAHEDRGSGHYAYRF